MNRYAILTADRRVVANIVEDDEQPPNSVPIDGLRVGPGDAYDEATGTFTPAPTPAPLVPAEVTMRQARLALLGAGKLAQVDAAIDSLPEPQRSAARIEWEYSNAVLRGSPFVASLAPALGMTAEQIDALFVAASRL